MPSDADSKQCTAEIENNELMTITEPTAILEDVCSSHMTMENFQKNQEFSAAERETAWRRIRKNVKLTKSCVFGFVPIFSWLPRYDFKNNFLNDLIAGMTVALMHIPRGLGFAPLASQEPVIGLYMAIFPVIIYFILGTSRHISLGMMAIVAVMVGGIVDDHSTSKEELKNGVQGYSALEVGIACSIGVGIWQFFLATFQLGSLCSLLSNSFVSGFTCGAAIHIIVIQLSHIFGFQFTFAKGPLKLVYRTISFFEKIANTNFVVLGFSCFVLLTLFMFNIYAKPAISKKCRVPFPIELLLIGIGILLSKFVDFHNKYGVPIVGPIASSIPNVKIPPISLIPLIAIDCLVIASVSISINISLAKMFAKKGGYVVKPNQELLAYGFSNIFGSFLYCLPVTAGLPSSNLQFTAGGKTELSHCVSLLSVLCILLFLSPFFEGVPMCALAAIIVVNMKPMLLQIFQFPSIWHDSKLDGFVWLATFLTVVLIDIDFGVGVGLFASVLTLFLRNIKTSVFILKLHKNRYVDNRHYRIEEIESKVLVLRIIGGINFVNSSIVNVKVEKYVKEFSERSFNCTRCVLVDFSAVPYIDPTGIKGLLALYLSLKEQDFIMIIAQCSENVYQSFKKYDVSKTIPKHLFIVSLEAAVKYALDK